LFAPLGDEVLDDDSAYAAFIAGVRPRACASAKIPTSTTGAESISHATGKKTPVRAVPAVAATATSPSSRSSKWAKQPTGTKSRRVRYKKNTVYVITSDRGQPQPAVDDARTKGTPGPRAGGSAANTRTTRACNSGGRIPNAVNANSAAARVISVAAAATSGVP
jgi:hypothetical protein